MIEQYYVIARFFRKSFVIGQKLNACDTHVKKSFTSNVDSSSMTLWHLSDCVILERVYDCMAFAFDNETALVNVKG